jgi:competence protein ComGC
MLMSLQTKKLIHSTTAKYLKRNLHAIKSFWPLLLLAQISLIIISIMLLRLISPVSTSSPTKSETIQNERIKNLEIHIKNLNEKFLIIQEQNSKMLSDLKSEKILQRQDNYTVSNNQSKQQTLEMLDRIGEKIRLNEPFARLLANISNDCINFPGYQTLHKYSTKLPLTFLQLKKAFDEIYKNYTPPKQDAKFPSWLEKIASFFRGKIKIEYLNQAKINPLLQVLEALEMQDLKLVLSLAKDINLPTLKLWTALVQERILLENEYSLFAERVQDWAGQPVIETAQVQPENSEQENNL